MTYPGEKQKPPPATVPVAAPTGEATPPPPNRSDEKDVPIAAPRLEWAEKRGFNMKDPHTIEVLKVSNRKQRRELLKKSKQLKRGTYKPSGVKGNPR